jgi:hypothetical protein
MSVYTVTSYYDFSTTASCGGSPIIVTSVGTGCNSAIELNANGITCAEYGISDEYKMYSNRCSMNALDLGNYTRNYVIKSLHVNSEQCQGAPLQTFALAADNMCHQNPAEKNGTSYMKTNCNGDQPIWEECSDSNCTKCNTVKYTNSQCQLASAGTSNKIECFIATKSPTGNNGNRGNNGNIEDNKNNTETNEPNNEPNAPIDFTNSAVVAHNKSVLFYMLIFLLVMTNVLNSI